ncbi:NnrU family protein [Alphaproteobacteria bacterium]|nr:NnrU family protein [Alphaproteobacteria bacterium]
MTLLIAGVLIWAVAHFFPIVAANQRGALISAIGQGPYKGLFALTIVGSIVLMVLGWRGSEFVAVYDSPSWARHVTMLLMFVAFLLFGASAYPSSIKRVLRHPMLSSVVVWAAAHLLSNGDQSSILLFGGLGLWALISIFLTNKRDGEWEKPEAGSTVRQLRGLVISIIVLVIVMFLHPYFTGFKLF